MSDKINLSLSLTNPPRRVPVEVTKDASSADLFETASKATSIPASGMKLIFRGRIIANKQANAVIEEFNLEEGCVIHCMGKPVASLSNENATSIPSQVTAPTATGSTVIPSSPAAASAQSASVASNAASSAAATSSPMTLSAALLKMKNSHPPADYTTALTTMQKLLNNIVTKPQEEKYRKVKRANAAFQKRLGRLNGAHDALTVVGFIVNENDEYTLVPSPEAWPKLLESKAAIDKAITEDTNTRMAAAATSNAGSNNMGFGSGNAFGGSMPNNMGMGGMPNMNLPPGMDPAMMSNLMSNPQMLQSMLSNPMVQQMMENHPAFAGNPMMQQQMRMLANNPQMLEQVSRMMSDPAMMENMRSMMGNRMGGLGGMGNMSTPGGMGNTGGMNNMDVNQQMEMMRQMFANSGTGTGSGTSAGGTAPAPNQQNQNQSQSSTQNQNQNSSNSGGDGQMTEEEMIAEAIARSLREQ